MEKQLKALWERKIYGVPIVVLVVVVIVVIVYARFMMPDTVETVDEPEGDGVDSEGDPGAVINPRFVANIPPNTVDTSTPTEEDSNENWARRAIEWLIANGTTVSTATVVITKYLDSEPLSASEAVVRDRAIKQFGLPPVGIIPTSTIPTAPTKTLPYNGPATSQGKPPLTHTVKGKADNTFGELSVLYYGRTDAKVLNGLKAANTRLRDPFVIGTKVTIPRLSAQKFYKATPATRGAGKIARKNATTAARIIALNPGLDFPVRVGTRVRVA